MAPRWETGAVKTTGDRAMPYLKIIVAGAVAVACGGGSPAQAPAEEGRSVSVEPRDEGSKWAVLIGVDNYAELQDLKCCGADVKRLGRRLVDVGFEERNVVLLCHGQKDELLPTKRNIERELASVLQLASEEDAVLVAFSGHGVRVGGRGYLCPMGASLDQPAESMISLSRVFNLIADCRCRQKLMLVDACRNNARLPGDKAAGKRDPSERFGEELKTPPEGAMLLTSSRRGQRSYEDHKLGHGVFMYHLLRGLTGEADAKKGDRNGRVSVLELYRFAEYETKQYVWRERRQRQIPVLYTGEAGFSGDWEIADRLASVSADGERGAPLYDDAVLSRTCLVLRAPDMQGVADERNQLGLAPEGSRVSVLKAQQDPALPVKWYRIRFHDGEYRGQTGWVSSSNCKVNTRGY